MKKKLGYLVQGILAHVFLRIFKAMPVDIASAVGGFIGRRILKHTAWNKIARKNLDLVYPDMSIVDKKILLNKIWNNIGRIAGEYTHLEDIISDTNVDSPDSRVNIIGAEHIYNIKDDGNSIIFVGAHMSNWEVIRAFTKHFKKDIGCIYRAPNNPYVRSLLNEMRKDNKYTLYPKNAKGTMAMTRDLKKGEYVGLLVDQWLSQGTETNFLGQFTKAPDVYAKFARKFNTHIVPMRFARVDGKCKFELIIEKEIEFNPEDEDSVVVQKVSDKITEYIHTAPESWLWIHDRFKRKIVNNKK